MARKHTLDSETAKALSDLLIASMPVFPKKLLNNDALQRKFKLPSSQLQILSLLSQRSMSVSQLSVQMATAKPNITPLIDKLCELNYVERIRDNHDRRIVIISITENGIAFLGEISSQLQNQVSDWTTDLTQTDYKKLINALSDVLSVMKKVK